jgi:hypothetical protein
MAAATGQFSQSLPQAVVPQAVVPQAAPAQAPPAQAVDPLSLLVNMTGQVPPSFPQAVAFWAQAVVSLAQQAVVSLAQAVVSLAQQAVASLAQAVASCEHVLESAPAVANAAGHAEQPFEQSLDFACAVAVAAGQVPHAFPHAVVAFAASQVPPAHGSASSSARTVPTHTKAINSKEV